MRSAPTIEWSKANFAIREALAQRRGPFVELAGPTHRGYQMIPSDFFDRERERIFVSNITTNPPQGGEVQLAADAGQLPFADESLGAVLACELPRFVREPAITEASRALEEGGLLIWQGVLFEDIAIARNHGLELVAYTWRLPSKVATALRTADRSDIGSLHAAAIELIKKLEADDILLLVEGAETPKSESLREGTPDRLESGKTIHFESHIAPDACVFMKKIKV